ncbi:hypothetical protein [Pseudarthrobacter sp. fls2-241-R2A-168]|uniref:hypothetical protein n=1 Tax=Pseudarthrobacter sp. fls2-241-R2A-168 TaxID=3040304 RepID=UPI0025522491|nr:hypothetical protein [Pseudarthrobacter sp. fls2-241-R2A-168]
MRTRLKVTLSVVVASMALSSCSIVDAPPKESPTPSTQPTQTINPTYSPPVEEPNVRLTVTTLKGNAGQQSTHHLVCVGSSAVEGTDLPDGHKACETLDRQPSLLEYDSAETSEECAAVDQPNIADVFGEINSKQVRTSFRRDNTCNVETWDKLKTLLGTITEKK